jgi:glycine/D-amino acid oxidase-like deaminating enzyme
VNSTAYFAWHQTATGADILHASAANVPVWDDGTWNGLPRLPGDLTADVCVVGLGGSGLTVIEELLARGRTVVAIDAGDVGAGAAGRNGGFLLAGAYDFYHDAVRLHGRDRAHAIYQATLVEIQRIAVAAPDTVRFVGSRRLAASPWEIDDCRAQLAAMQADGLSGEWREDADGIGLFLPADASFNPLRRCRLLAQRAEQAGAQLFARTPAVAIDGTNVVTPHGVIHASRVIVAIDGHLEQLLPELTGRVRTARLQMLATAPTDERVVACPMYWREGYEYWQQTTDGRITIGGFRDQAGESEWSHDATPTARVQDMLERFVRDTLGVTAPITHRWAACAGYSNTGLPVLAEVRRGVFAIGGYSGTGNVIGALCGRAIVALAIDGDAAPAEVLVGPIPPASW